MLFIDLIGKRINGVYLAREGWTLVFRTTDGEYHRYDTENDCCNSENDCCNSVWVNHMTGIETCVGEGNSFDLIRGALVVNELDKGWTGNQEDSEGGEYIDDGFWTIQTDRGYIDIEVRNSNNGYYGGSFSRVDDADIGSLKDLRRVVKDF